MKMITHGDVGQINAAIRRKGDNRVKRETASLARQVIKGMQENPELLQEASAQRWKEIGAQIAHLASQPGLPSKLRKRLVSLYMQNVPKGGESSSLKMFMHNASAGAHDVMVAASSTGRVEPLLPVITAIRQGDLEGLKKALGSLENPNQRDAQGKTLLEHVLKVRGVKAPIRYACLRALFDAGADPNTLCSDGIPPVCHVCRSRSERVIALFLAHNQCDFQVGAELPKGEGVATPLLLLQERDVDERLIEEARKLDGGATKNIVLNAKALAHRFAIAGTSYLGRSTEMGFDREGWSNRLANRHQLAHAEPFYTDFARNTEAWKELESRLQPSTIQAMNRLRAEQVMEMKEGLLKTLSAIQAAPNWKRLFKSPRCFAALQESETPITLYGGVNTSPTEGHTLAINIQYNAAKQEWVVQRCNKGWGSGALPGIVSVTMKETKDVIALVQRFREISASEDLDKVRHFLDPPEKGGFFDVDGFDPRRAKYIRQKRQKEGNCTIANANSFELGLLIMQFERLMPPAAAQDLGRQIQKMRTGGSRFDTTKEYLNPFPPSKELAKLPPDYDLLFLVAEKCLSQGRNPEVYAEIRDWFREEIALASDEKTRFIEARTGLTTDQILDKFRAEEVRILVADRNVEGLAQALRAGLSPNLRIGEESLLHLVVASGDRDMMRVVLKAGADPNVKTTGEKAVPVIVAASNAHQWELMKDLIEAGANPDAVDARNASALFGVCADGNDDLARFLVAHGADPTRVLTSRPMLSIQMMMDQGLYDELLQLAAEAKGV